MWLLKHKFHANGSLSRYKARLVANGRSQQQGINCNETFSPVVKPATIRTVLSLAVSRAWPIHQLDVKNAFLYGHLSETINMHQPPGFHDPTNPDYGNDIAYLLLYFDDIILTASSASLLQHLISSLHSEFSMSDHGPLNYFLGISAQRTSSGLFLSQAKYATEILERAHMLNCNPSKTSVTTESKLGPDGDPEPHYTALKRILCYIRGTLDHGLLLYRSTTTQLVAYSDVDWAGCPATRHSTSGYCVFFGDILGPLSVNMFYLAPVRNRNIVVSLMSLLKLLGSGTFSESCLSLYSLLRLSTVTTAWPIHYASPTCAKYATEILERAHMLNYNPSKTPVTTEAKLGLDGDPEPHYTALKRIVCYIRGTLDHGLLLYRSTTTQLVAYSDADWVGCPATRHSTSGYYVFFGDIFGPLSVNMFYLAPVQNQNIVSATLVYCDNVSAVYLSSNSYANIFTKGLPSPLFTEFRSSLSIRPPSASTVEAY
nr:hypothetical protein [Tanacetum cinerariifolium]